MELPTCSSCTKWLPNPANPQQGACLAHENFIKGVATLPQRGVGIQNGIAVETTDLKVQPYCFPAGTAGDFSCDLHPDWPRYEEHSTAEIRERGVLTRATQNCRTLN